MSGLVKICGLTRAVDVEVAVDAGADALGFNFWPPSPRAVTPGDVADWTRGVHTLKVGVFVNQSVEDVRRAMETAGLDVAQLHGDEDANYMNTLGLSVWKAVHLDRLPAPLPAPPAEVLLVDSGTREMPGGTGVRVDVERARDFLLKTPHKVLLAGGLKADTVAQAVLDVRPFGVDVSSGVEVAPGKKDPGAVRAFVQNAREAFQSLSTKTHD